MSTQKGSKQYSSSCQKRDNYRQIGHRVLQCLPFTLLHVSLEEESGGAPWIQRHVIAIFVLTPGMMGHILKTGPLEPLRDEVGTTGFPYANSNRQAGVRCAVARLCPIGHYPESKHDAGKLGSGPIKGIPLSKGL